MIRRHLPDLPNIREIRGPNLVGQITLSSIPVEEEEEVAIESCPIIDDYYGPDQSLDASKTSETVTITPEVCSLATTRAIARTLGDAACPGEVIVASGRLTFQRGPIEFKFERWTVTYTLSPAVDMSAYTGMVFKDITRTGTLLLFLRVTDSTTATDTTTIPGNITGDYQIPWTTLSSIDPSIVTEIYFEVLITASTAVDLSFDSIELYE